MKDHGRHAISTKLALAGVLAAAVVFGGSGLYPPPAGAEPNSGTWDIEAFDDCLKKLPDDIAGMDPDIFMVMYKDCCLKSGGVFRNNRCWAPGSEAQATPQRPGNVQIPPDIGSAPVVTPQPPRRVPPDVATAPGVTQAPSVP